MYDFDGKKALIIGATGGMGASVAAMLAKNGAQCALVGSNNKNLKIYYQSVHRLAFLVLNLLVIFLILEQLKSVRKM